MLEQAAQQLNKGSFENAIEAFTACLLVDPKESQALRGRATARFQLKDWSGAEAGFRKALELDSAEPENRLGVAMSLAMRLEVYPAIAEFETLTQQHPDFVRGHIQLALFQIKIGAITKGKSILQEALMHRPSMTERRFIEDTLTEQDKLDKGRYYRPDFEALKKRKSN